MSEKEYIVTLNKGVDPASFAAEMTQSTGSSTVPNRSVDVANARLASNRNTHYALSEAEAEALKNDSRVMDVAVPPDQDDTLEIGHFATQDANWQKTSSDTGDYTNWGLYRCHFANNPYPNTLNATPNSTEPFRYSLDGSGVDVVIQDSGLQMDHPEFTDEFGGYRTQAIDWYDGFSGGGTQNANHYRDYNGHGTHCGGIAAGKTYGWAKAAEIYSVKVSGLEGSGDSGTGISVTDCFDVIKEWHNAKPVSPTTGKKRPTVVNMSWGYGRSYTSVSEINYRGVSETGTAIATTDQWYDFGLVPNLVGLSTYQTNVRIASVDTDVEELIDAGVHVCIAAGNRAHKVDVSGGLDYDNFAVLSSGTTYYHRGSSPYSTRALMTGNIEADMHNDTLERLRSSSEKGPGVDIYAPGSDIMSASSNTNEFTTGAYHLNSSFRQMNISGTSMASPQVCGVIATILQANPGATPEQIRTYIHNNAQTGKLYTDGTTDNYQDTSGILNGPNRYLFTPFNLSIVGQIGRR